MFRLLAIVIVVCLLGATTFTFHSQESKLVCKRSALAAWKPIPKLRYPCSAANDYDEKILKLPARKRAISNLVAQLATFNSSAWWQTSTDDLNVCDFQRRPGTLTETEKERFSTNYAAPISGNNHIRLLVLPDPCFQSQYNGANAFILYRRGNRVVVSQVLDGFFSRAEDAVNMSFASLGKEELIEISTGTGGLHPQLTNYYFAIDSVTNRAVPKNLFQGDDGPTNQITSALLMSDPEEFGLPTDAVTLKVFNAASLAKSFSIYAEDPDGEIDDNGRKLTRTVLTWDGKIFK